jgi:hypothetical protein
VKKILPFLWKEPAAAAVLAVVMCSLILREGILFAPDGWGYWEGSVSLLHGQGFTYFGGHPIFWYPPLFSLYLALWQGLLGVSGHTLCVAVIACCGASALIWTCCFRLLFGEQRNWLHSVLLVAFVSSFLAVCNTLLQSEPLQLVLQGLLLLSLTSILLQDRPPNSWQYWGWNLWLGLLVLLLLACKNSSLAFVPAVGIFLLEFTRRHVGWSRKSLFAAHVAGAGTLVIVIPLLCWYLMRQRLHQLQGHRSKWFDSFYRPEEYLYQIWDGNIHFLAPHLAGPILFLGLCGLLIAGFFLVPKAQAAPQRLIIGYYLVFVVTSVFLLFLMMNLVEVWDLLRGRYLWFMPLMLVGAAIAQATWVRPRRYGWAATGFLLVLVGWQVFRAVSFAAFTPDEFAVPKNRVEWVSPAFYDMYRLEGGATFRIRPEYTMSPDWYGIAGKEDPGNRAEGDLIIIGPPHFFWIDREYEKSRQP